MSLFKIFALKLSFLRYNLNRNKANILFSTPSILRTSLLRYYQTDVSPLIVEETVALVKKKPKKSAKKKIRTEEEERESKHFSGKKNVKKCSNLLYSISFII